MNLNHGLELIYARQIYKQQMMNIVYGGVAQTRFFDGVQGDPRKQGWVFSFQLTISEN